MTPKSKLPIQSSVDLAVKRVLAEPRQVGEHYCREVIWRRVEPDVLRDLRMSRIPDAEYPVYLRVLKGLLPRCNCEVHK